MEEVVGSIPTRSTKSPNNLDGANACSDCVCVVVCVVTCRSSAHSEGFHRVALRFHADVAVSLQHPSADVPCDCHDCRIGCAALRKPSNRAMPEIVEAETRQPRLLCQGAPSRPPAFDVSSRVERCDFVVDDLLAAKREFRHESRKDVMRWLGGAERFCSPTQLRQRRNSTSVKGTTLSPAAVFDVRIVRVRANRSTSDHCRAFNSHPFAVVFRQRIAARCAVSPSGCITAALRSRCLSSSVRALPMVAGSLRGRISSATRAQSFALFRMRLRQNFAKH